MDRMPSAINCRLAVPEDKEAITSLMQTIKPPVAGLTLPGIYAATCHEAFVRSNPVIVVAEYQACFAGFMVAVPDWQSYWRGFFRHHPILAVLSIATKLRSRLKRVLTSKKAAEKTPDAVAGMLLKEPSGRSWAESSSTIAKVIFLAADPNNRCAGVGEQLVRYMFAELRSRGIKRLDAMINLDNVASVKVTYKVGWPVERIGSSLFASIDL